MARPKSSVPEPKRLNLELSPEVYQRMVDLMKTSNAASVTEVLRRAFFTYEKLVEASTDGKRIVMIDGDVERDVLVI